MSVHTLVQNYVSSQVGSEFVGDLIVNEEYAVFNERIRQLLTHEYNLRFLVKEYHESMLVEAKAPAEAVLDRISVFETFAAKVLDNGELLMELDNLKNEISCGQIPSSIHEVYHVVTRAIEVLARKTGFKEFGKFDFEDATVKKFKKTFKVELKEIDGFFYGYVPFRHSNSKAKLSNWMKENHPNQLFKVRRINGLWHLRWVN